MHRSNKVVQHYHVGILHRGRVVKFSGINIKMVIKVASLWFCYCFWVKKVLCGCSGDNFSCFCRCITLMKLLKKIPINQYCYSLAVCSVLYWSRHTTMIALNKKKILGQKLACSFVPIIDWKGAVRNIIW